MPFLEIVIQILFRTAFHHMAMQNIELSESSNATGTVRLDECERAEENLSRTDEALGEYLLIYHPRRSTTRLTASFSRVDSFWIVMLLAGAAVSTADIFTERFTEDEVAEIEVLGTKHGHRPKISDESDEQGVNGRPETTYAFYRTKSCGFHGKCHYEER